MSKKPLNVADEEAVKRAQGKEELAEAQAMADWKHLLDQPQFRRVVREMLGWCGTFRSIWEPSAKIHYYAGQQDVGHRLMGELAKRSPTALAELMAESYSTKESE